MSPRKKNDEEPKKANRRSKSKHQFPEEVENLLRGIAQQAAGKPLGESLGRDSALTALLGRMIELVYEAEMSEHLGYEPNERLASTPGEPTRRSNTRNGYSQKHLKTSHGAVAVQVPRDRNASFEPQIVGKHRSLTEEMEARIISMYAKGMTTRDIETHVEELYGLEASPMLVSRAVQRIEPELKAWRNRPLEQIYAVVFIDAIHLKVRHAHGVRSTAAYIISGIGESGQLEILSVAMASEAERVSESATYWHQVLLELRGRGVEDVMILSADGLRGLDKAVHAVYPDTRFQRCVVHLARASLQLVNWKERKAVAASLRAIYQAGTYEQAELELLALETEWGRRYPAIVRQWQDNLELLSDLWSYGPHLRKAVYTTNALENINRQVRKVTKSRGAMPSVDSALDLITLVLREIDAKNRARRTRHDWSTMLTELHILFGDRLPADWGYRHSQAYGL
jgi:putative transposase